MNVTIDGRDIEVAEGTTILEAAKGRNSQFPRFVTMIALNLMAPAGFVSWRLPGCLNR